jgi:hypothetical protein
MNSIAEEERTANKGAEGEHVALFQDTLRTMSCNYANFMYLCVSPHLLFEANSSNMRVVLLI